MKSLSNRFIIAFWHFSIIFYDYFVITHFFSSFIRNKYLFEFYRLEITNNSFFLSFLFVEYFFFAAMPKHDPVTTGLSQSYALGDEIEANCTSDQSNPPSDLTWYIDERKVSL